MGLSFHFSLIIQSITATLLVHMNTVIILKLKYIDDLGISNYRTPSPLAITVGQNRIPCPNQGDDISRLVSSVPSPRVSSTYSGIEPQACSKRQRTAAVQGHLFLLL